MIDIKVPAVGESISEVTLVKWLKQAGAYVERDEVIAELESEKATFEVNAEQAGVLKPVGKEGDTLKIGDVVAQIQKRLRRLRRLLRRLLCLLFRLLLRPFRTISKQRLLLLLSSPIRRSTPGPSHLPA